MRLYQVALYGRPRVVDGYHGAVDHLRLIRSKKSDAARNIVNANVRHRCALTILGDMQLHDRAVGVSHVTKRERETLTKMH